MCSYYVKKDSLQLRLMCLIKIKIHHITVNKAMDMQKTYLFYLYIEYVHLFENIHSRDYATFSFKQIH